MDKQIDHSILGSLNDQRLTGQGCDLYITASNGIGYPCHASVICSQSEVFQLRYEIQEK